MAKIVEFEVTAPGAECVYLAGDFNNWDSNSTPMRRERDGNWKTRLKLTPGRYEYKFWVDGEWREDPKNRLNNPNPFGTANSILEIH
jgi:1,4-alpha-glucan branching enzyme